MLARVESCRVFLQGYLKSLRVSSQDAELNEIVLRDRGLGFKVVGCKSRVLGFGLPCSSLRRKCYLRLVRCLLHLKPRNPRAPLTL